MNDIQIITCSTIENSIVNDRVKGDVYVSSSHQVPYTTVRKFKGLEAEHVIMVDIDKQMLTDESLLFYVGASRAKLRLTVIANIDDDDCVDIIKSFNAIVRRNNPKETLAKIIGCKQYNPEK